ncbi:MAG TPA: hypothetical protein VNO33_23620 [Kofleriaceae bacterium]|nr:hypothetical protein [Kofleriaceae bacterium]
MSLRRARAWAALLAGVTLAIAVPARAQESSERIAIEVRGEWAGTDQAARGRAVDQAFASAVERGLRGLVGEKDRAQHRDAIDKAVVRRARLFLASYRVLSESRDGGKTQVVVSATVDLAKLRATLTELKVPVAAGRGGSAAPEGGGAAALLLLKVTTPDGTVANFGRGGGDGGAAGDALAREIQAMGLRLRSASGEAIAVTTSEGDPLLPVGDEAAVELARRLGVASVWVVGMDVRADGPIRGTRLLGAAGRGKLRVLDAERGQLIAESEAGGAGFERGLGQAAAAAARDLSQHLAGAVAGKVDERWSAAASAGGPIVLVRVRGAHTWASIGALIHKLGGTSGVDAVHAREVVRGRIALGVETRLAPARVASALQQARLPSGTLTAQARGERQVDVEIRGDTAITGVEDSGDAGPE